ITACFLGRFVAPRLRVRGARWDRRRFALVDLGKFVVAVVSTIALAYLISLVLHSLGWDPRGSYVDTFVQRNALVVGIVMGFAVIPIIYTLSEDALSAVPEHLRSASLGAGATPWQTAVRIIIPTAMSGLFSALMVGLGRAVGETMIVLMAAGNTPVLEWNIFEGFRTLSANIAVELPEAVQGSTHYRTLFLAALVLFLMTFIVNTVAETIRLRFRKRAYQL
ncbi:MAG: ABC transporter permease subunit, partial [bacterium]|nr:ABC transporter permease subunit [bacterium]